MASSSERPRALITGLGGFTGRYLASVLERAGYHVLGTSMEGEGPDLFRVDLRDREAVRACVRAARPHVVAHLAAVSFVAHGDAADIHASNVVGTCNLLDALIEEQAPLRSVLLASSSNVYGNTERDPLDEDAPLDPVNDYAVSKVAMEMLARVRGDRLPLIIVRPFNYTGAGQDEKFLLPKIVSHFRRGEREIELGNIDVYRDFSDVRSVVRAYARLLDTAPAGTVVNICSGRAWSLREILALMARIAGYTISVRVNPAFVRANEVLRLRGDATRLKALCPGVEWIPLEETLGWMYGAGPDDA